MLPLELQILSKGKLVTGMERYWRVSLACSKISCLFSIMQVDHPLCVWQQMVVKFIFTAFSWVREQSMPVNKSVLDLNGPIQGKHKGSKRVDLKTSMAKCWPLSAGPAWAAFTQPPESPQKAHTMPVLPVKRPKQVSEMYSQVSAVKQNLMNPSCSVQHLLHTKHPLQDTHKNFGISPTIHYS